MATTSLALTWPRLVGCVFLLAVAQENKHDWLADWRIDRLPTVSAAQALEEISTDPRRFIPTGIAALDEALVNVQPDDVEAYPSPGGFQRGQVAEIWGPPGSGKTAFG